MSQKTRSTNIDALKGLAILAVVLYHASDKLMPSGYLGVDVFLVVAGYFMMLSMLKYPEFFLVKFITDRLFRIWPLVLAAAAAAMAIGCFTMLPDDFENLCESVVASNLFANNILACMTTKNYWDVVNEYKPLMHTWYLGVLMQGYVLCAVVFALTRRLLSTRRRNLIAVFGAIWAISLILYLLPVFSIYTKFYWLPFRLFEILSGSLIALLCQHDSGKEVGERARRIHTGIWVVCTIAIVGLLFGFRFACRRVEIPVIITVAVTSVLLYSTERKKDFEIPGGKFLAYLGVGCFSIYIWHQLLLAFGRYCIFAAWNKYAAASFLIGLIATSVFSFYVIEKKFCGSLVKSAHRGVWFCVLAAFCIASSGTAFYFYRQGGCVRDVPEMDIYRKDKVRNLHANYNSRAYKLDRDFTSSKKKVLVVGHSYARDWCNVIAESKFADKFEISYIYHPSRERVNQSRQRFLDADFIFYVEEDFPSMLPAGVNMDKTYMVGTKYFGVSNGLIYQRRFFANYKDASIVIPENFMERHLRHKAQRGDHYIDMISPVQNLDGSVRVFTPEGKFISQDCRHLTRSGARYYAEKYEPFFEKLSSL
jgi:peptidoglycan/LPS O-acetylase OafA/YrhL